MPRVGDVFQLLSGTLAVPNTTIQSAPYNAQQQDWTLEANSARPISAGGTGATTATAARTNLGTIGAGDLAAAATKTPVVDTDSLVIIDSDAANVNKRWLVSDFRASLATLTNIPFSLVSTDGTSTAGPILTLDRQSPTAATNDILGVVRWYGRNSAEEVLSYGQVFAQITDHVNNQEKSSLYFQHLAGTGTTTVNGMILNEAGATFRAAITAGGNISGVDFHAIRPSAPTSGVIFLGNQLSGPGGAVKGAYLHYDGSSYNMPSAPLSVGGSITSAGNVTANGTVFASPGNTILQSADLTGGSNVYLRAWSNGTYDTYLRGADGFFIAHVLYAALGLTTPGSVSCSSITISSTVPQINFYDTDNGTRYIQHNGGLIGFLNTTGNWIAYGNDAGNWTAAGRVLAATHFQSTTDTAILGTPTGNNEVQLRPLGNDIDTNAMRYTYLGNLYVANRGFKLSAGDWEAASDARIKTVTGDYETGLEAILNLDVRRFTFRGNDSDHAAAAEAGTEFVGLIAQEAELVMPDLVRETVGTIDNEVVSDFRIIDTTNITYALVNAVKTLAARIQTLEETA